MKENFVEYEEAIALKELGFNEPCFTTYDNEGRLRNPFDCKEDYNDNVTYIEDTTCFVTNLELTLESFTNKGYNPKSFEQFVAAPLYQQAFMWILYKYNIYHELEIINISEIQGIDCNINITPFPYEIKNGVRFINTYTLPGPHDYTYGSAYRVALKELIELIKNK